MKKFILILFFSFSAISLIAQNQIKTTSVNVNLRQDPWIDNNIICVIPKSSLVVVNSDQHTIDWIKINFNGHTGYAYSKYVVNLQNSTSLNYDFSSTQSNVKYYTNSKGERVQSPTYYKTAPAGATAECRDGTYSFSRSRRGTCSHHGGVKRWL
ncbi:MAG: DUF3761 domain-containing protein [Bacteroidales bacterium]|nr:DUF3761 domain-containing protein [Bacteroidales bacterium]